MARALNVDEVLRAVGRLALDVEAARLEAQENADQAAMLQAELDKLKPKPPEEKPPDAPDPVPGQ